MLALVVSIGIFLFQLFFYLSTVGLTIDFWEGHYVMMAPIALMVVLLWMATPQDLQNIARENRSTRLKILIWIFICIEGVCVLGILQCGIYDGSIFKPKTTATLLGIINFVITILAIASLSTLPSLTPPQSPHQ